MINLLNAVVSGVINPTISDEDLILRYLQTQNMSYFSLIYERYSGKVFAKCITILKDTDHAKDAMQDIFMKVLLSVSNFKGNAKFSTWLYSITYNYCIDETRRLKKYTKEPESMLQTLEDDNDEGNLSDEDLILGVDSDQLKLILDELKVEDKTILLMKYLDELSINEIQAIINKSEGAIKMQLKRAKERFLLVYKNKFKEYEE
jgi:RNA polymerase sigma-70 factor (ECF subfamily)